MKTSTELGIRVTSTSPSGKYPGVVRVYKNNIKVACVEYNTFNPLAKLQKVKNFSKYLTELQAQLILSARKGLISLEDFKCVRDEFNLKIRIEDKALDKFRFEEGRLFKLDNILDAYVLVYTDYRITTKKQAVEAYENSLFNGDY